MIIVGYRPIYTRKQLALYERAVEAAENNPVFSPALLAALKARVREYYEETGAER